MDLARLDVVTTYINVLLNVLDLILFGIEHWVTSDMTGDDVGSKGMVAIWIHSIFNDAENIETRQDRLSEFDILRKWNGCVVASTNRIGSSNDGASSLQTSDNTSL